MQRRVSHADLADLRRICCTELHGVNTELHGVLINSVLLRVSFVILGETIFASRMDVTQC